MGIYTRPDLLFQGYILPFLSEQKDGQMRDVPRKKKHFEGKNVLNLYQKMGGYTLVVD